MRSIAFFTLCAAALCFGHARAQAPCETSGHGRMDFWLGDWALSFENQAGETVGAANLIQRVEGGCVIEERFDGLDASGFTGRSWSVYDARADIWRQTWVDSTGSYLLFEETPVVGAHFALMQTNVPEAGPFWRMIWTDVSADAMTWSWQSRVSADAAWTDVWVIAYERKN